MIAMPDTGALSASVTLSSPPKGGVKSTRAATSVPTAPTGASASSLTAESTGDLVGSSTGASFDWVMSMPRVATLLDAPGTSATWNEIVRVAGAGLSELLV